MEVVVIERLDGTRGVVLGLCGDADRLTLSHVLDVAYGAFVAVTLVVGIEERLSANMSEETYASSACVRGLLVLLDNFEGETVGFVGFVSFVTFVKLEVW